MRRLRNWLRRSMKTDRLTSLALMNIPHDIAVDYDEAAMLFFQFHLRKINQKNLVFQYFKLILGAMYTVIGFVLVSMGLYYKDLKKLYKALEGFIKLLENCCVLRQ